MTSSHAVLATLLVVGAALPVARWGIVRVRAVFDRHDARLDAHDRTRVHTAAGQDAPAGDPVAAIEPLVQEELRLVRAILDERIATGHVSQETARNLQRLHRHGLDVRHRCADPTLASELGILQGFGSLALMADLATLDRAAFEHDLAFRAAEVRRAVALRCERSGEFPK